MRGSAVHKNYYSVLANNIVIAFCYFFSLLENSVNVRETTSKSGLTQLEDLPPLIF